MKSAIIIKILVHIVLVDVVNAAISDHDLVWRGVAKQRNRL